LKQLYLNDVDLILNDSKKKTRNNADYEKYDMLPNHQTVHFIYSYQDNVARKNALNTEISSTLRAFYCSLCDKQFKTVAQYDEHTNSYAHHHKARFRDMQANVRVKAKEDVDKQKEKERKREERELRKIAAANGIKMAKIPSSTLATATVPVPELSGLATGTGMSLSTNMSMDIDGGNTVADSKTGGWASLSAFPGSVDSPEGFKKSGWATIDSSSSNSLTPSTPAIDRQPPSVQTAQSNPHTPTFRNAGWSSLDTGSLQPFPVTNQTSETSSSSHGASSRDESSSGQRWQSSTEPTASPFPESGLPSMPLVHSTTFKPAQVPQASPARSNWQQFQKGTSRRK
jgi:hypothetical protein